MKCAIPTCTYTWMVDLDENDFYWYKTIYWFQNTNTTSKITKNNFSIKTHFKRENVEEREEKIESIQWCLHIPSMEEERQPKTVELIRHIRVEERQKAAHIIQTMDLHKERCGFWNKLKHHNTQTQMENTRIVPVNRVWPPHGSTHAWKCNTLWLWSHIYRKDKKNLTDFFKFYTT